jgi:hypothetical protein
MAVERASYVLITHEFIALLLHSKTSTATLVVLEGLEVYFRALKTSMEVFWRFWRAETQLLTTQGDRACFSLVVVNFRHTPKTRKA